MKTVEEINREILQLGILKQGDKIPNLLKEWAESIIDKCADKADIIEKVGYYGDGDTYEYETVDTDTILSVKKLL